MKNFTNNFKQFTSRLSARWLIMALMMLVGTSAMLAANSTQSDGSYRLYFKFSGGLTWWNNSGCYHYAWVWANGGAGQVQRIYKVGTTSNASTNNTTDVFYMNIPNGMTLYGMILFRGTDAGPANGSTTFPSSYHNKTNDITLPNNISAYNLVTAVTESSVTQNSRYTTVSLATTTLSASGYNSGSGTEADPYVYDENGTMELTASATIDDHNFQIQLSYGSSTATIASGSSKSIDVSLTTAQSATAYTVTYTPLLGGSTSYKGTASTKTIYYKTAPTCTTVNAPNVTADAICAGSTATLTLSDRQDGVTYRLNSTTGNIIFSSDNTYTTPAALNANTTYTIYASHEDACDGTNNVSGTVTVTVNAIPATPNVITSATVCPNTAIALSSYDNDVANVSWYTSQQCEQKVTSSISIDTDKTYYARAENGNCYSDVVSLALSVYETPATPTVSFSANPVGQNKPTTLTVGGYNSTLNNYTLYKNGDSQGAYTTPQTITIGEAGEYDYHVVATSKACPSLTATSETVTLEVLEAGAKIVQLGDLTIYTNIKTDFVPMYVQNDGIMDVDGATSVKGYTWQYSQDGNSWDNCTTNYASGVVGMSNGGADCNNWRADKAGRYRCLITYDNDETQYSNVLSVSGTTGSAPALNTFGDLPIISVNTGSKSFPDECSVSNNQYPSANADNMKKKISVDVKIYDKTGKLQYDRKARMNYRGSSSLNFKKKSYAFVTGKEKTKNADGDVDTGKANLFGLSDGAKDKDWVLYAATPDPSMMRNRLVFDLYKDMTGKWGVNSMFVELIVNNEYKGVYVLMDKITNNEKRINITSSEGFIVKFDKTDVADRIEELLDDGQEVGDEKTFKTTRTGKTGIGTYNTEVDQLFEIEYPEKDDIQQWSAFYESVRERFEKFETALANKDYATVRSLIDYDSWADWFIINEFTKNMDAYRASCLFVYNGDKIEARPLWDQELSFNNRVANIGSVGANSTSGLLIQDSGVYGDAFKAPFWFTGGGTTINGGLLNDPCFVSLVKQKWATYKEGVLSTTAVSNKVSAYANELPSTAITRENNMLPFNNNTNAGRGATSQCTGYKAIGYYGYGANTGSATDHATSKSDINTWVTNRIPALTSAIDALNGEALIFTLSPSSVETTPWQQVMITVNAPDGYEYTFDDSSINNATVKATVKKSNDTYAIKIPRPSAWGVGGNGNPNTQTQYQVSATIEVSGESECGTIQNGTATSTITLKDVTEVCDPEIVKP